MNHALNISAANPNAPRLNAGETALPTSLAGMTRAQLREAAIQIGVDEKKAKMRAEQLWRWIYHYGAQSFDDMTNTPRICAPKWRPSSR